MQRLGWSRCVDTDWSGRSGLGLIGSDPISLEQQLMNQSHE